MTFFRRLAVAALALSVIGPAIAQERKGRRILFFTKSSGFEHEVIKRKDDAPSIAGKALLGLAERNGWQVVESKDGSLFSKEYLDGFDALLFFTSGDLTQQGKDNGKPMTPAGKAALLEAVEKGKGFVGVHAASDTFHTGTTRTSRRHDFGDKTDPFVRMLGGEFLSHGKQQRGRLTVTSPAFPGIASAGPSLELTDEWYSFTTLRDDLHVILVQETATLLKEGKDATYDRPPYPSTWARKQGEGRVFYTSLGHREDVWTHPLFHSILEGGLKWAMGDLDFDPVPNVAKVTPEYRTIAQEWVPLFNGKDLEGWTPKFTGHELGENYNDTFRVEGGVLKVSYDKYQKFDSKFGHLFYKEPFSNYRLRVEYRFVGEQCPDGPAWALRNSGVMIHGQPPETMRRDQRFPVCIEVQFLGGNGRDPRTTGNLCTPGTNVVLDGKLHTKHCTNSLSRTFAGDQWVSAEVEVHNSKIIRHFIDGEEVLSYAEPQYDDTDPDGKTFIKDGNKLIGGGTISLQAESHPIEFRKVEILLLKE